jgi:uncharacterized BrkB/YihY/UPF0761 family membrane protein
MGGDIENGGGSGAAQAHVLSAPGIGALGGRSLGAHAGPSAEAAAIAASLRRTAAARRAAVLAVHAGLTIAAGLIALGAALALLGSNPGTTNRVLSFVDLVGPANAVDKVDHAVANAITADGRALAVLVVALAMTALLAAGYFRSFSAAAVAIEGPRNEHRARVRFRGLPALVIGGVGFALALAALLLTGPAARAAVDAVGGGHHVLVLWNIGKWPLIAGLFASLFLVLHCLAVKPPPEGRRLLSNSQLAAGTLWAVAIVGFLFYLGNFDSFDGSFGGAGSAVVSVLWLALFSVLYYGTPSLTVDGFGPVMPGLAAALALFLAASGVLALGAAMLDPYSTVGGAAAVLALTGAWLWASNFALVLGSTVDVELGRAGAPTPVESAPERKREAEVPPRPLHTRPEEPELERIVRIALADDTAHRGMWSALPGAPEEVPSLLTGLECDLNDWGFAYGVAWAVAKTRYPFEPDTRVAERALEAARTVFGEYCAGENWSERLSDRRRTD